MPALSAARARRASRWHDGLIAALATKHSLEVYAALYALVWGVATMLWPQYLLHAHTRPLYELADRIGEPWMLGVLPALTGGAGLWALATGRRSIRGATALLMALQWWMASYFFALVVPPVTSAIVAYGMSALAEGWVYVRVNENFDELARDCRAPWAVPRHDRHALRRD